jgi:gas vesicle protein
MAKLTGIGLFAAGAGLGAVVALLYAPRAGKYTRAHLRNRANRTIHRAEEIGDDLRICISELVDDASEAIASGKASAKSTGDCLLKTFDNIRAGIDKGRSRVEEYMRSASA